MSTRNVHGIAHDDYDRTGAIVDKAASAVTKTEHHCGVQKLVVVDECEQPVNPARRAAGPEPTARGRTRRSYQNVDMSFCRRESRCCTLEAIGTGNTSTNRRVLAVIQGASRQHGSGTSWCEHRRFLAAPRYVFWRGKERTKVRATIVECSLS